MKATRLYKYSVPALAAILVASAVGIPGVQAQDHDHERTLGSPISTQLILELPIFQTDPSTSLSRGRTLLKQGHADQALPLLESALTGFTSTNNARGIAAAQDALGDLYMI